MSARVIDPTPAAAGRERSVRFILVGGLNTLFGMAIYPALLWTLKPLGLHYMVALLISQAVSLVFAYATQKLLVFRTSGDILGEFIRFSSFYLGVYAINWVTLPFLVEVVGLRPIVAQFGFTVLTVLGSYLFHSRLTFRPSVG